MAGNASDTKTLLRTLTAVLERYHEFADLLGDFHQNHCITAAQEVTGELAWTGLRLVVAHDPATAAVQTQRRGEQIDELIALGDQWAGKLVDQDEGVKRRGRKLSDSGAKARFYHAVCEAHLSTIIKVDLPAASSAMTSTRRLVRWLR